MNSVLTDEQLMQESCQNSLVAFEILIRRWDQRMLYYFLRYAGNQEEAQDLRQELFFTIYQKRQTFRANRPFRPWLYRIATNLAIDKVTRKRKLKTESLEAAAEPTTGSHGQLQTENTRAHAITQELSGRVQTALNQIPNRERLVLVMRHFEHLSFRETAEILNLPESTVKSRAYRGLASLRSVLKEMGIFNMDCLPSE